MCSLCNDICKLLDFLVLPDKNDKPEAPSRCNPSMCSMYSVLPLILKLVNPYHEFAISFGKGVGIGEVSRVNIRVQCEFVFLRLSLL